MMGKPAPHILVVGIQKGGIGKTSLSISLAGCWAAMGYKVGIADFDPQRNATYSLLAPDQLGGETIRGCIWDGVPMEAVGVPVRGVDGLTVYPGSEEFDAWEQLLRRVNRETLLRKAHQAILTVAPQELDVLIVDTPPTLGVALNFALAAAHSILIPTEPERLAVQGFGQIMQSIAWTRDHVNPELRVAGIVINKASEGTVEHRYWIEQLRERFGRHVLDPVIPRRVAVSESQSRGVPIEYYGDAPKDVKEIFRQLARNVAEQIGLEERSREMAPAVVAKGAGKEG